MATPPLQAERPSQVRWKEFRDEVWTSGNFDDFGSLCKNLDELIASSANSFHDTEQLRRIVERDSCGILCAAARHSFVDIIEWCYETAGLSRDSFCARNNYILRTAACCPQNGLLDYLVDVVGLQTNMPPAYG